LIRDGRQLKRTDSRRKSSVAPTYTWHPDDTARDIST
jgi:hypothetical protein